MRQCERRIVRIGQSRTCELRYLIAPNTIEVDIWQRLQDKVGVLGSVLDGKQGENMAADKRSPGRPAGQQTLNFVRAASAAEAAAKMFANAKTHKRPLADNANQSARGASGRDTDDAIVLDDMDTTSMNGSYAGRAASAASGIEKQSMSKRRRMAKRKSTSDDIDFESDDRDGDSDSDTRYRKGDSPPRSTAGDLAAQLLRDAAARDAREAVSAPRRSGSGDTARNSGKSFTAQPNASASRGRARGSGQGKGPLVAPKRRTLKTNATALPGGHHGFSVWLKQTFPLEDEIWPLRLG